jgi:hypothetical protein
MAKKMNRIAVPAIALIVTVGNGCGADMRSVTRPFAPGGGVESGPGSGLWGDGSSGPSGMHIGCIRARRFCRSHHRPQPLEAHDHAPRWRWATVFPRRDRTGGRASAPRTTAPKGRRSGCRASILECSELLAGRHTAGARRLGAVELPHAKLRPAPRASAGDGEPQHHPRVQRRRQQRYAGGLRPRCAHHPHPRPAASPPSDQPCRLTAAVGGTFANARLGDYACRADRRRRRT